MANRRNLSQDNTRFSAYDTAQSTQLLVQSVELVQSQELVQIMACAVVHHYDIENPNHSYKDFREAVNHTPASAGNSRKRSGHRYVPWDILVPGTDPRVDKLLEWLELGMIDALSHRYLNTLQLGIYDGEVCLSKRVEAYIMAFSYLPDGIQMELQLSTSRDLPSPGGRGIESVKQELRFLVHRLANHIGGFPELPAGALVNMQFTYNDSCPQAYQPPGFVKCLDHRLILRDNQGAMVGSINPGPHRVDLKVYLNEDRFEVPSSPDPLTIVKLRGSAGRIRRVGSLLSNDEDTEAVQQKTQISDTQALVSSAAQQGTSSYPVDGQARTILHPNKDIHRHASNVSNFTAGPDSQERAQLAAISNMARLRSARDDLNDTQVLDAAGSQSGPRCGSVDLDGESSTVYESSTQGSPSTASGRHRTRQVNLNTKIEPPPRDDLVMLRPRKREIVTDEDSTPKLRKVSQARSPFATAFLRN